MNILRNSPIGVIDSGIGGLSLLKPLVQKYTHENYIYLADNLNMPYGNKSKKWIVSRITQLVNYLYTNFNVKLVILACNTASSCLNQINKNVPVKVVGLDFRNCLVDDCKILCTKLTAKNYNCLNTYPCSRLAEQIEDNFFDNKAIDRYIKRLLNKSVINEHNIVLGCTHYELVYNHFKSILTTKNLILPCKIFVDNFKLDRENTSNKEGDILMLATIPTKSYIDKLWKIFKD